MFFFWEGGSEPLARRPGLSARRPSAAGPGLQLPQRHPGGAGAPAARRQALGGLRCPGLLAPGGGEPRGGPAGPASGRGGARPPALQRLAGTLPGLVRAQWEELAPSSASSVLRPWSLGTASDLIGCPRTSREGPEVSVGGPRRRATCSTCRAARSTRRGRSQQPSAVSPFPRRPSPSLILHQ
jgi:hypothetical protein